MAKDWSHTFPGASCEMGFSSLDVINTAFVSTDLNPLWCKEPSWMEGTAIRTPPGWPSLPPSGIYSNLDSDRPASALLTPGTANSLPHDKLVLSLTVFLIRMLYLIFMVVPYQLPPCGLSLVSPTQNRPNLSFTWQSFEYLKAVMMSLFLWLRHPALTLPQSLESFLSPPPLATIFSHPLTVGLLYSSPPTSTPPKSSEIQVQFSVRVSAIWGAVSEITVESLMGWVLT